LGLVIAFICLLSALALPAAAAAQEIYIWTDEKGIRNLSDRRPNGDYEVKIQRAIAEPEAPVEMANAGTRREPEWQLANRLHGPVTVQVQLSDAVNVVSSPELPARLTVPAQSSVRVLLGAFDPAREWRYRIGMQAVPGALDARHDDSHVYRLPIAAGTPVHVGQGFGGAFSHDRPGSRYAVDFTLPVGTTVRAARAGTVMDQARWFHTSGQDLERDAARANYVRVLHDDGSMAVYAHLDYNGILIRPGQQVAAGQRLARSGNTGYSTGPHLHFAVQVNRDMQLVSVPFRMVDDAGRTVALE